MRSILGLFLVLAVAAAAFHLYRLSLGPAGFEFRTQPASRGDLFLGVSATGTLEPVELVDVGAQIVGCIKQFGADPDAPGKTIDYRSRVRAGSVLAQLDDTPHRAELEKADANVRVAEAEVLRAQARLEQADRDCKRNAKLGTLVAQSSLESALLADQEAKAEHAMSQAKLEYARSVRKQAEINLGYTTIRSPIDGVVIDRRVNVGQTVVAGLNAPSLFLLAKDLGRLLVWSAVNEADIGEIKVGGRASFQVDAYRDRTFSGTVSQIRLNASMQQNVVTYGVVVDVDNPDGKLLPYMTAKLRFEVDGRKGALLVPSQALRWRPTRRQLSPTARIAPAAAPAAAPALAEAEAPGREEGADGAEPAVEVGYPAVFVVADDGLVRPVAVKPGLSDGVMTELVGGELAPGTPVVVKVRSRSGPDFVSSFVTAVTKKG